MQSYALFETDAMLAALDRDGCILVPATLTRDLCDDARRRIDRLEPQHWDETHAAGGRFMDRYLNVFNRDAAWLRFLDRPGIIDLAEAALGPDCHVIGETAWRSHPGFRGEPLHARLKPHASFLEVTRHEGVRPGMCYTATNRQSEERPSCGPSSQRSSRCSASCPTAPARPRIRSPEKSSACA